MDANVVMIIGAIGFLLGIFFLFLFFMRRISRTSRRLSGKKEMSPGIYTSFRNLLLIFLWIIVSISILFIGFFLRSYHSFTLEKPVAEVYIQSTDTPNTILLSLSLFSENGSESEPEAFSLKGDQWVLEGDILKWNPWLNFLGMQTRYRFTRIRGRYLSTEDEKNRPGSVYSLVSDESNPFWRYMYRYGSRMPFVSSAYGNAVFQDSAIGKRFLISVTASGFIAREKLGGVARKE